MLLTKYQNVKIILILDATFKNLTLVDTIEDLRFTLAYTLSDTNAFIMTEMARKKDVVINNSFSLCIISKQ